MMRHITGFISLEQEENDLSFVGTILTKYTCHVDSRQKKITAVTSRQDSKGKQKQRNTYKI